MHEDQKSSAWSNSKDLNPHKKEDRLSLNSLQEYVPRHIQGTYGKMEHLKEKGLNNIDTICNKIRRLHGMTSWYPSMST